MVHTWKLEFWCARCAGSASGGVLLNYEPAAAFAELQNQRQSEITIIKNRLLEHECESRVSLQVAVCYECCGATATLPSKQYTTAAEPDASLPPHASLPPLPPPPPPPPLQGLCTKSAAVK